MMTNNAEAGVTCFERMKVHHSPFSSIPNIVTAGNENHGNEVLD